MLLFFFCLVLNLFDCFTFQKFNSCKLSSLFIKPSPSLLNANFINKLHNQIKIKGKVKERERKKNIFIQSNDNLDQQSTHYYSWEEVGYLQPLTFMRLYVGSDILQERNFLTLTSNNPE